MLATTAFYAPLRGLQDMTTRVIELDTAITELRRVADWDDWQFNDVLEKSIENIDTLGGKLNEYMEIVSEFSRMGVGNGSPDDTLAMSNTAQTLVNISDLNAEQSVNALVSAMTSFNITAEESIQIADKLNEVDNEFSITSLDLALSIGKASSTAKTFGVTLDELIGYTTAIGSATRESGNIVGNSLKTLFSRITTNESAISALNEIGISMQKSTGETKNASELITELAGRWDGLSEAEQRNSAVKIAGIYQLSRFNALMLNFGVAQKSAEVSSLSAGSALAEQEKYAESLQARINRLDTAWSEFSLSMGEIIITDSLVSAVDVLGKLLKTMAGVIQTVGALSIVGGTLGGVLFALSARTRAFSQAMILGSASLTTTQMGLLGIGVGASRATIALTALRTAAMGLVSMIPAIAIFAGLGFALEKIIQSYSASVQAQEEFNQHQQKGITALSNNRQAVEGLINQYDALSKAKDNDNWNSDKEEEYLKVQQELADMYPALIDHIDTTGQAHLKNRDAINEEIKATEKLIEAQNKVTVENASAEFKRLNDELNGAWYDSFGNFLTGSLGERINQQRNIIDSMYDANADSGAIAKAEFELLQLEQLAKMTSEEIKGHIFTVANAMSDIEISGGLSSTLQDFVKGLDVSNLNNDELEAFSKNLGSIQENLQKSINSGNTSLFDTTIADLNELASSTGNFDIKLNGLTITYDELKKAIEDKSEIVHVDTEATEENTASIQDYISSLQELSSVEEKLVGISNKQVSEVRDLIYLYETLSAQTDLTAQQTGVLEDAQEKLALLYPHLIEGGRLRTDKIYDENEAQGVLLEAYKNSAAGKYTSEQNMTLIQADATSKRIENIKKEIQALQALTDSYNTIVNRMNTTTAAGVKVPDEMKQFMDWAKGKNAVDSSELGGKLKELSDLQNSLSTDIGSLRGYNTDVGGRSKSGSGSSSPKGKSASDIAKEQSEATKKHLDSTIGYYEKLRSTIDSSISYEQSRQNELTQGTTAYAKSLQLVSTYLQNKQKVNQQELDHMKRAIDGGKYQGEHLQMLKDRYRNLTVEMQQLKVELQDNEYEIIINIQTKFNNEIDDIQYAIDKLNAIKSQFEQNSPEWMAFTQDELKAQKELTSTYKEEYDAIQKEIRVRTLNGKSIEDLKEKLEDLHVTYLNSLSTEKSLEKSMQDSVYNMLVDSYKSYIQERQQEHQKSLDNELKAEQERHDRIVKNYEKEQETFRKNVQERLDLLDKEEATRSYDMEMDELESERKKINEQINLLSLSADSGDNEAKSKRKKLQEELDKIDKDIAERQHDRGIELQRESLQNLLDSKDEEINGYIEAENIRYENVTTNIDKQKEYWNQYYEDLATDERKFAKLREDIMKGNFDNINKEFGTFIEEMKNTMPSLENTMDGTMKAVGTSVRQNVIANLQEAVNLMSSLQSGSFSVGSGNTSTLSNADMKVLTGKYLTHELAKSDNTSRSDLLYDRGVDLAKQGRSEGSKIDGNILLNDAISKLSKPDLEKLGRYIESQSTKLVHSNDLQELMRQYAQKLLLSGASLDVGGMTPNWSGSGVDRKGGRFAVLHPNEIIHNPIDTENLLKSTSIAERILNIIKPITNKGLSLAGVGGGDIFNVQFGDVHNATQQQAEKFASSFITSVKRGKGGIK